MSNDRITLILSDLHVADGAPGDDHVYDRGQLVHFLRKMADSPEGQAGRFELYFNGDFLEFAQTDTEAFVLKDEEGWCTQDQSLRKLEAIIQGHPEIFRALADFQEKGNLVTIAAGNHDVDLYWPGVQSRVRQVAGPGIQFELGKEWVERYGGKLQIGHGHMHDIANKFKNWQSPFVKSGMGPDRLEMCPGTLFMVKFVNALENRFPFADNLLPVTKLAAVLRREDTRGFASVAWAFFRFLSTTSFGMLGSDGAGDEYGERLVARFRHDGKQFDLLMGALRKHGLQSEFQDQAALTADGLAKSMFALLGRLDEMEWCGLFELEHAGPTLSSNSITLSAIFRANFIDGREKLREAAQMRAAVKRASVVVMGHTHQPDIFPYDGGIYYNPGSWTRYWELDPDQHITLADLKDESQYPYRLSVVRVEEVGGVLQSEMITIESWDARQGLLAGRSA